MFYIVGTPIGNLKDLSIRQASTIISARYLLTEDTRTTGMLVSQITKLFPMTRNPDQQLISYNKVNEFEKLPYVIDLIREGNEVVLISQAGVPLISDPGSLLVSELVKLHIPFTVVPGPTAATTALLHSGMDFRHYVYYGFLPKKSGEVAKTLKSLRDMTGHLHKTPIVFYESPERINNTLGILEEIDAKAQVSISRELTKLFEETKRGLPVDLKEEKFKGELVLVVLFSSTT